MGTMNVRVLYLIILIALSQSVRKKREFEVEASAGVTHKSLDKFSGKTKKPFS